jgi:hypothetical protein
VADGHALAAFQPKRAKIRCAASQTKTVNVSVGRTIEGVGGEGYMPTFDPQDPDFQAAVRESFDRLTLMRTIGAALERT